jgi:hypothetical protein
MKASAAGLVLVGGTEAWSLGVAAAFEKYHQVVERGRDR